MWLTSRSPSQLGTLRRAKRKVDELTGIIGAYCQTWKPTRGDELIHNNIISRLQPSSAVTPPKSGHMF